MEKYNAQLNGRMLGRSVLHYAIRAA